MDQPAAPDSTAWPFPFPPQDWEQTPPAVQAYLLAVQHDLAQLRDLQNRVEVLEARLKQDSTTSHRPPSLDHPSRSRTGARRLPHPAKRAANLGMSGIVRYCCRQRPCTRCTLSDVSAATRHLACRRPTRHTKCLSCRTSRWRSRTGCCIRAAVWAVARGAKHRFPPSMPRAMGRVSVP